MMQLRMLCNALILTLLLTGSSVRAEEKELPSADARLAKAVELFKSGDYEKAGDLLKAIKTDELTDEDRQLELQRYLSLVDDAIKSVAAAKDDYAKAEEALKAEDKAAAKKHLEAVVSNKYSPAEIKSKAEAKLNEIAPKPVPVAPAPKPAEKSGSSILEELSLEHQLLWQQAIKTYKDAEAKIRQKILDKDFAEAFRLMDYAKQTIELNRRYAPSAGEYEDYRNQGKELEQFLKDEKNSHDELLISEQAREVAEREERRKQDIEETKRQQIAQLLAQSDQFRRDGRYEEAIQVLKQILVIDPKNADAALRKDILGDLAIAIRDKQAVGQIDNESQDAFVENDESRIPWHKEMLYPKNWPAITAKRTGASEEQEPEANRLTRMRLKKRAPELKFDAEPFEQVIDKLRKLTGLNIVPNWTALEAAAIEKDAEVSLRILDVTFEKALELILDAISAGEVPLGYTIDDGVVQISTKEDLSRKTKIVVYNVQDLLITVPTFRGRTPNTTGGGQGGQEGGLGGGRYLRGGGGGGGGGGGRQGGLFGGGGGGGQGNQQGDEEGNQGQGNQVDPLQPIIDLIQQTIDPESWREAGGNVGTVQALHQQLIISQTATAHTQIRDLLEQLRRARALQIGVEARYLTITRNWVEQIGVDLDVVLNNGNAGFDKTTVLDTATNNPILVPRQFVRNGFMPGAPGGVGIAMPTQPFGQPYGQPGLVPAGSGSNNFTPIPLINNTLDLASPSDTNVSGSLGSLANTTPAFQVFGSFLDNIQVDFLLRATQVDRRASDLDAPRLVLFNGQRAMFESFLEQDYIAALTPIIGDNAGMYMPNIDTALTGRSLDVQATVSADRRYVTMTIRTFTEVTGDFRTVFFGGSQTVGTGFVELASRRTQIMRTTVNVPDGGTLLIGGLKLSGERDVDAGVPILSRIPVLKRAFSNTSNVKDDQVLLILIKPSIIIQEEAEADAFPTLSSLQK